MLGVKETEIGEHTYKVTQLLVREGHPILYNLQLAVAEGLTSQGSTIAAAFKALPESKLDAMCKKFAEQTLVTYRSESGEREEQLSKIYDLHFAGKYEELYQWLFFCVEVNFAGFFTWAAKKLGINIDLKAIITG